MLNDTQGGPGSYLATCITHQVFRPAIQHGSVGSVGSVGGVKSIGNVCSIGIVGSVCSVGIVGSISSVCRVLFLGYKKWNKKEGIKLHNHVDYAMQICFSVLGL